jgi:hypothetical protein
MQTRCKSSDLEMSAARRVIAFLEDRRVLCAPDSLQVPSHCVASILEIRRFLNAELGKLETGSEFAASLRAMRAASRKFLKRVATNGREVILPDRHGHSATWAFYSALEEMRGTFGVHIAKIAADFSLRRGNLECQERDCLANAAVPGGKTQCR